MGVSAALQERCKAIRLCQKDFKVVVALRLTVNLMNPVVIYSTKDGNIEKVALEIAEELNCKVIKLSGELDFSTISLKDFDLVFIGTWGRGGGTKSGYASFLKAAKFGR